MRYLFNQHRETELFEVCFEICIRWCQQHLGFQIIAKYARSKCRQKNSTALTTKENNSSKGF